MRIVLRRPIRYVSNIDRNFFSASLLDCTLQHTIKTEDTFFGVTGLIISQLIQVLIEISQTFSFYSYERILKQFHVALSHVEFCPCSQSDRDAIVHFCVGKRNLLANIIIQRSEVT